MSLPAGLTLRPPEARDAEAVARLCNAETMAILGLSDTTPEELLSSWSQPFEVEGPRDVLVVDGAGTIVAFVAVDVSTADHEVFGYGVVPVQPVEGLADALLAELEERAGWWHRRYDARPGVLRIGGLDAPGVWVDAVERGGYQLARRFLLMRAPLGDPPEPSAWPPGYALRPFDRDADARAVHAAFADGFADHFGPPYDPYDPWFHKLFVQPALSFRDDLILVAWCGDEVAGALVAAETAAETADGGYVGELAVRRAHRKRGLGRALLLESFARLRELGRTEVLLHVDADSETNATGLYRSVGMREQPMYGTWLKPGPG